MLILTRYIGERIIIGDDIIVEIVDAYTNRGRPQVRLGIAAPRSISVHREEIWEKIKAGEEHESKTLEGRSEITNAG